MSGVELWPFVWALPLTYGAASFGSNICRTPFSSSSSEEEDHPAATYSGRLELNRVCCEGLPGQWMLDGGEEDEDDVSSSCVQLANQRGRITPCLLDESEEGQVEDTGLTKLLLSGSEFLLIGSDCLCFLSYFQPEKTCTTP